MIMLNLGWDFNLNDIPYAFNQLIKKKKRIICIIKLKRKKKQCRGSAS